MKSHHTRLDPIKDEVLEVTGVFGRFRAMEQFHINDYPCFCRWLKEVTGDENFGINPKIKSEAHYTLGDQLVDAMLRKVAQLQTENEKLRQRAEFLQWQLQATNRKEETQALAILQKCEV